MCGLKSLLLDYTWSLKSIYSTAVENHHCSSINIYKHTNIACIILGSLNTNNKHTFGCIFLNINTCIHWSAEFLVIDSERSKRHQDRHDEYNYHNNCNGSSTQTIAPVKEPNTIKQTRLNETANYGWKIDKERQSKYSKLPSILYMVGLAWDL